MNIAVIQISEAGSNIAKTLQRELGAKTIQRADVGSQWKQFSSGRWAFVCAPLLPILKIST